MKPNIFNIATKELSQDAFITWLILWADNKNVIYDEELHKCGVEFVKKLIRKKYKNFNEEIYSVQTDRQWENIDVIAKINDKYLIIIEDKTFTKQHSGQLKRYKLIAEKWCEEQQPKYKNPICIYLKTGNESQQNLNKVKNEGFDIFNRQEFISLLDSYKSKSDIFSDFKTRLKEIEKSNNEWNDKIINEWGDNDWQGFFQYLEKKIDLIGWDFVNNKNGGFWNAVLNWDYWGIYPVYLQTEEYKLCFKISTDPDEPVIMPEQETRSSIRNKLSNLILSTAEEHNISTISKPERFGTGNYMTVAIVKEKDWLGENNKKINVENVVKRLLFYKKFLLDNIIK